MTSVGVFYFAATTYLTEHWSRPETPVDAVQADPLREPDAGLLLAEARALSGTLDDDDVVRTAQHGGR